MGQRNINCGSRFLVEPWSVSQTDLETIVVVVSVSITKTLLLRPAVRNCFGCYILICLSYAT